MRTLAALLIVAAAAFAQSPNTGSDPKACAASGIAVDSSTHAPIPRVHIEITLPDELRAARSDAAGKWQVEDLPCGSAAVTVSRVGYITGKPLTLQLPAHELNLELTPQVVLAGRVIDDLGDPIQGARVSLLTSGILEGRRTMLSNTAASTNDLGEYRLAGLSAGRYTLCAAAKASERCLPGLPEDGASGIQAVAGYAGQIDFVLSPLPVYRASGAVAGAHKGADLTIRAMRTTEAAWNSNNFIARNRSDGTFIFPSLPAGAYTLSTETEQLSARASVLVTNSDMENIQLRLEPRINVTANLQVLSATGKKIGPQDYSAFIWSGPSSEGAHNDSSESFSIHNVIPGTYHFSFTPPKGFYLKSATLSGHDIIASGLTVSPGMPAVEVTVSDDGGTLEGDVTADEAPANAWIYLESAGRPVRNSQTGEKGHFQFDAVPPGDYLVYAWDDNSKVEYANQSWMQRYGKPAAISVAPHQTAHLKLVRQIAPE